jgi:hypothetical protein
MKLQPLLLGAIDERLVHGMSGVQLGRMFLIVLDLSGVSINRLASTLNVAVPAHFSLASHRRPRKNNTSLELWCSSAVYRMLVSLLMNTGFYHASRRHGVIYSTFNDYWLKRIDGFRRVPLPVGKITD